MLKEMIAKKAKGDTMGADESVKVPRGTYDALVKVKQLTRIPISTLVDYCVQAALPGVALHLGKTVSPRDKKRWENLIKALQEP